jgi:hypothetical protein
VKFDNDIRSQNVTLKEKKTIFQSVALEVYFNPIDDFFAYVYFIGKIYSSELKKENIQNVIVTKVQGWEGAVL